MWLIATPVTTPDVGSVLLNVRIPDITKVYEESVPLKRRATRMVETQCARIQINLLDNIGRPVNLENYGFISSNPQASDETITTYVPSSDSSQSSSRSSSQSSSESSSFSATEVPTGDVSKIVARYREATLRESQIYEVDGLVLDTSTGLVRVIVPPQISADAGIYTVEFGLLDAADCLIFTNVIFLYNETSGWGSVGRPGPPAIDDIRLSLRDNDPYDNLLLDNFDFDLAELCHAVLRTVQFWNDQPPPVASAMATTKTFPFRDIWLEGIQYYLFRVAEEHYRRNVLKHVAGGTQIDDKNRWREYRQAWNDRFAEFRRMVMHRKAQLNAQGGFSSLRSGYDLTYSYAVK